MRYFSLFSGIGGFELGLQEGFECVGYSEINEYALQIYRYHFPQHKNYGDATQIIAKNLPDFDLLVAGFPCQAFSIAGKRLGFHDTRGTLFFEIARILRDKRPRHFLLENVRGLLSHNGGKTFQTILGVLTDLGYEPVEWQVLNSKDFGVPQNRERIFIVGHLRGKPGPQVFPIGEDHQSNDTLKQKEREKGTRASCLRTRYGQRWTDETYIKGTIRRIGQIGHGHMGQRIYDPAGVAISIMAKGGGQGAKTGLYMLTEEQTQQLKRTRRQTLRHDKLENCKIRKLTPKECERLQGFPDDWTKWGIDGKGNMVEISDSQRYNCLGNAVTVNVIREIAIRLLGESRWTR